MLYYFKYLARTWYWRRVNRQTHKLYGDWECYRLYTNPIQLIQGDGIVYEDVKSILEPARLWKTRARIGYVVYSYVVLF